MPRPQFRLRSLFILTAIVAVGYVVGLQAWHSYWPYETGRSWMHTFNYATSKQEFTIWSGDGRTAQRRETGLTEQKCGSLLASVRRTNRN